MSSRRTKMTQAIHPDRLTDAFTRPSFNNIHINSNSTIDPYYGPFKNNIKLPFPFESEMINMNTRIKQVNSEFTHKRSDNRRKSLYQPKQIDSRQEQ